MDSAVETSVIPTEPIQNGESHLEAEVRPEVSDTASKTTSSNEKVAEIAPKITEKAIQKSEVKPVKSNKKLKEEEKKLKLLFKSFEDMENPEAKLDALGRKYLQLASEHKITDARKEEFEKRLEKVVRERDQLQSDFNKASLAKNKLESLCRELQRHSKLVKEESQLRSQEEEAKRKELSEKFQTTINDISEQMQENYKANQQLKTENNDLAARLKGLVEQYEVREEHVEKVFKHKQLELQLAEAKMAQQHLQFDEEKKKTLTENQKLIQQAMEYQKQCEILTKQEAEMKSQLAMYAERFEEFQKTLNKSNEVFTTFKKEMDKMTKTIKKLEKEKNTWKTKCESSNRSLLEMVDEREKLKNEMAGLRSKNEKLENLCRALHKGAKVTSTDIDQAKETSTAHSNKEGQSSGATFEDTTDDKSGQRLEAGIDTTQNSQTHDLTQRTGDKSETQSEGKLQLEEKLEGSVNGDSSTTAQEAATGNPSTSEDPATDTDPAVTVSGETPSIPEDVANESENNLDENVSSETETRTHEVVVS